MKIQDKIVLIGWKAQPVMKNAAPCRTAKAGRQVQHPDEVED